MGKPLRVLIVEDSEDDALIVLRELRRSGYEPEHARVDQASAMRAALANQPWDVIIADYTMPRFGALAALELLTKEQHDIPFIIVTGTIDDETASAGMRAGAQDYIMKDNLARLGPVIERELRDAEVRQERRRAEEALALLDQARSALAREMELADLIHTIVESIPKTFGYTMVSLYLLEGDTLILQHQVGYEETIPRIPIAKGVTGRVVRTGKPVLIEDVSTDSAFLGAVENIVSEICIPLVDRGEAVGALNVESRDRPLTPDDFRLMEALSEHVNVAIERARLYAEIKERAARMELIALVGNRTTAILALDDLLQQAVQLIRDTFGYYNTIIMLVDGEEIVLRATTIPEQQHNVGHGRLRIGEEGITGQVAASGESMLVPDVTQNPYYYAPEGDVETRSEVAVPIQLKGQVIGVLDAESAETAAFTQADVTTLQAIADQLAVAIENARLFEQVERSEQLHRTILENSADAIVTLNPEMTFVSWSAGAERIFGYSREEIIGRPMGILVPEHERKRTDAVLNAVRKDGFVRGWETQQLTKDGRLVDVEMTLTDLGPEMGLTAIMRDVTGRKQAEEALAWRNRVLETLSELSREITSTLDIDSILATIARVAVEAIDATSAYICDWNGEQGTTTVLAECFGPHASEEERVSDRGITYNLEEVFGDTDVVQWLDAPDGFFVSHVADPDLSSQERLHMEGFGGKSVLGIPIRAQDRLLGYIEIWESRRRRDFSKEEIEFAQAIARQVSTAIENARLHSELMESQERLLEAQRIVHLGNWDWDFVNSTITWSDELYRIFGASPDEMETEPYQQFLKFLHPDDRDRYVHELTQAINNRQPISIEHRIVRPDGQERHLHARGKVLYDSAGRPIRIIGSTLDITERKQLELRLATVYTLGQKLLLSRNVDEIGETVVGAAGQVLNLNNCGLWLVDRAGAELRCRAHTKGMDYAAAQAEFILGGERGVIVAVYKAGETIYLPDVSQDPRYVDAGYGSHSELCAPLKVGERVFGVLNAERDQLDGFSPSDRQLLEALANAAAIALENAQLFDQVERSEATLASILSVAPIGIGLVTNRVLGWTNRALHQMVGYSGNELMGQSARILYETDEEFERVGREKYAEIAAQGTGTIETHFMHKEGAVIDVLLSSTPIDPNDLSAGVTFTALDITERKKAEQAIRRRARELAALNALGRQVSASLSVDETVQATLEGIVGAIHPDMALFFLREEGHLALRGTFSAKTEPHEETHSHIVGECLCELAAAEAQPLYSSDIRSDSRCTCRDCREAAVTSFAAFPLTSGESVVGLLGLASITERDFEEQTAFLETFAGQVAIALQNALLHDQVQRHADELEQRVAERTAELQAAYERVQELAEVRDEFVSNVSHELRTPITSLKLRHDLAKMNPEKVETHLAVIGRETKRLENIIEDLLLLSRLDQSRVSWNPRPIDLNWMVGQYIGDRAPLGEEKELVLTFEEQSDLPAVQADASLLGQVVSILLTNALNYTPPGGRIRASTHTEERDGRCWVGFSMSDSGPGILPEEMPRLFERFFRGKAGRESGAAGTGLGLAIVKEIVERHQGHVEAFSEGKPGKGVTFTVWLPADEGEAGSDKKGTAQAPQTG